MQIVIEIDNEHYERIMRLEEGVTVYPTTLALYEAVKNGTPLEAQSNRCDSCTHSEELDGSNCYECVKGMADNFEAQPTKMRDATEEERKSVKDYIESISKPTRLQFDEVYEELDFVAPHRKLPVTLEVQSIIDANNLKNPWKENATFTSQVLGADGSKVAFEDVPADKAMRICAIIGEDTPFTDLKLMVERLIDMMKHTVQETKDRMQINMQALIPSWSTIDYDKGSIDTYELVIAKLEQIIK